MKVANYQSPLKGGVPTRGFHPTLLRSRCTQIRPCCRKRVVLAAARSQDRDPERDEGQSKPSSSGNANSVEGARRQTMVAAVGTGTLASLACLGGGGGNGFGHGFGGDGGGEGGNPLFEIADAEEEEEEEEEEYEEEEEEEEGVGEEVGEGEESGSDVSGSDESTSDDEEGAEEDEDTKDLGSGEFKVDEVIAEGLPEPGEGVPTQEELLATCSIQPGFVCNRKDIANDKKAFVGSGIFHDVRANVVKRDGKNIVIYTFKRAEAPTVQSLSITPHKSTMDLVLPEAEVERIRRLVMSDDEKFNMKKMFQLKYSIEDWYRKQGYSSCFVTSIDGVETGNLKVKVLEGRVGNIMITPVDKDGNKTNKPGIVPSHVILREVPVQKGEIFHQDMPQKVLRDVFGLGLFENMSVGCNQSRKDETKFDIDLQIKERPAQTGDLELEWALVPSPSGKPGLASPIPGGSLTWENNNLFGKGRTLSVNAQTSNFWQPSDDITYQVSYRQPDVRGIWDSRRTEFNANIFNTRNVSAIFAGSGRDEMPPIMIDRTGAKLTFDERYSRNSSGQYGLVLEQVVNMDDNMELVPRATKMLPTGEADTRGPPTSLSPSGKDRLAFLQARLTRDTTYFVNGTQLGDRQTLQVQQGVGLGDTKPIFNRQHISLTRFQPLGKADATSKAIPGSLVVHAGLGCCVGDQPPYDLFALGGPLSVRGYNVGEIGASRAFGEGAVELRLPVKGRRLYAFAEGASDLGSSRMTKGNPTAYFSKPGHAFSLGAGVKLGAARVEAATEGLSKPTVFNIRFGERF